MVRVGQIAVSVFIGLRSRRSCAPFPNPPVAIILDGVGVRFAGVCATSHGRGIAGVRGYPRALVRLTPWILCGVSIVLWIVLARHVRIGRRARFPLHAAVWLKIPVAVGVDRRRIGRWWGLLA